jgi:predicted dehydrogenase
MKALACTVGIALASVIVASPPRAQEAQPLRLAIAGLVHGHVSGFLRAAQGRKDVEIVGVFESDAALLRKYAESNKLSDGVLYTDLAAMIDRTKPDAIASFTNTYDHPAVVEAAAASRHDGEAARRSNAHAQRIRRLRRKLRSATSYVLSGPRVHGRFSGRRAARLGRWWPRRPQRSQGDQVQPEFFSGFRSGQNGAGALFGGCYGANLMTWMMDRRRPLTVGNHAAFQPTISRVDDEARSSRVSGAGHHQAS